MRRYLIFLLSFLCIAGSTTVQAQRDLGYQTPPPAIADLVNAPQTPDVSIDRNGAWVLLMERPGYPSIAELAEPELRIAGLRINPATNGSSRSNSYMGLILKEIASGKTSPVLGLPDVARVENVSWSPDGTHIAFTNTRHEGLELWVADVASQNARRLTTPNLNDALGGMPYTWIDGQHLLVKMIPADRGEAPVESTVPAGPVTQETSGSKAPVRTYQDLLENPHDEALFEYYATSQLLAVDIATGDQWPIGQPGIISEMSVSPNQAYILTATVQRPFSYLVPYYRFPVTYDILHSTDGKLVHRVAEIPLSENIPKGFEAVREGPRDIEWRDDAPATLCWVEAQDGGDPNREAEVRDRMYFLPAPFTGAKQEGIPFRLRYAGVVWGKGDLAVAYESWWSTRQLVVSRFNPIRMESKNTLFDYSYEDRYSNPGNFATTENEYSRQVLLTADDGRTLFLTGQGASPEGNRPFLRKYDLASGKTQELWRSQAPYYEFPIRVIDPQRGLLITRRESREEPPNYFLRNLKTDKLIALTDFPHPYPALKGIEKQVVKYQRNDGVALQGNLYVPSGYDVKKDGPLPVIMWAYPNEFKSADAAGQVEGSPYEFIRLYWGSPLYWVTQGYAILDDPGMPIVGEGEAEPNDHFREQLVANAEAAVAKLVDMGVADPKRIAIGGHSYGAFMTANLLAHSDLFAAGIARSGAYNRTLTPFGFQSEERTYWEAPEVYYAMSPFMHADKINEPILLIHGEADNNSGTFPIQSERFYAAIKGLGGTARLVLLPHESHGYRARESILHMLWEQNQWLEKYVKNKGKEAQP